MDEFKKKHMDADELSAVRNELVVKSNELIRDARYSLSEQEQKLLIYVMSQIRKEDTVLKEVRINVKDYCEIAGIKRGGSVATHIKKSIKSLSDKSWWFSVDGKKEKLFRWIDTAEINGDRIDITLSDSLSPYLLDLTRDFTRYELINVLPLRGKYAIRLFELFKSYQYQGQWKVKLTELKEIINCEKYPAYKEFNRNVLKSSIEEINGFTELFITYRTEKVGRQIDTLIFKIEEKNGIQLQMELKENVKKRMSDVE